MSQETINKSPSGRVKRAPVGRRNVLTVGDKEAGYVYRVVNDTSDNVLRFQELGYEFVADKKTTVGDKRVNQITSEGVNKVISVGGGVKAFVMRIKQEDYNDLQADKQEDVTSTEDANKQNALTGTYGKLEISR